MTWNRDRTEAPGHYLMIVSSFPQEICPKILWLSKTIGGTKYTIYTQIAIYVYICTYIHAYISKGAIGSLGAGVTGCY